VSAQSVLLALLPITAGFALLQRRRLHAIIAMAAFSLLLATAFFLADAPDVAITEAAIGAALVTLIYVLAIRKTGRLTVAASEAPGLIGREGERIVGLEWEILERLAQDLGLELAVQFGSHREVEEAVLHGDVDVGAGGIVSSDCGPRVLQTPGHLPTARFTVTGPGPESRPDVPFRGDVTDLIDAVRRRAPVSATLDLARFLALSRHNLDAYRVERREGEESYTFALPSSRGDLHRRLLAVLARLRETGELDSMIRRHFP
jgi:energy-converting hydrogenase B subunit D